jgi:catechol 2,3-dioxygenase-like lactoylglutathione lyase family enzyme
MIQLNHVNVPVQDIAASQAFYAKYFSMETVLEIGQNYLVIMRDQGGLILNLSHFDDEDTAQYPKDFHLGFYVDWREEVQAIHALMAADGLAPEKPQKLEGRYTFKIQVPGGVETEVACPEGDDWQ